MKPFPRDHHFKRSKKWNFPSKKKKVLITSNSNTMTQLEDDVLLNNLLKFPGTIIIYNNDLNSEYYICKMVDYRLGTA